MPTLPFGVNWAWHRVSRSRTRFGGRRKIVLKDSEIKNDESAFRLILKVNTREATLGTRETKAGVGVGIQKGCIIRHKMSATGKKAIYRAGYGEKGWFLRALGIVKCSAFV